MPRRAVRREEEHLYADAPKTAAGKELAAALLKFQRASLAQRRDALHASGLSSIDLQTLRIVVQADREDRSLSPKNLIAMIETSSANVTNIVARLERKGYVDRVKHPTDRRAHHLKPTDAARELIMSVIGDQHAALVGLVESVSTEEARVVAAVLDRFSQAFDEAAESHSR